MARLAASRLQMRQALYPVPPLSWPARAQAACGPSLQRHPLAWVLGALVVGGLGAVLWQYMPDTWVAKLKSRLTKILVKLGQEALLSWWLTTLQAHERPPSPDPVQPPKNRPPTSSSGG